MDGALGRVVAIVLGAATGFCATAVVWPESAAKRVRRALSEAIMTCSTLVCRGLGAALGEEVDLNRLHSRFLTQDAAAREAASSVRSKARRKELFDRIEAVERLWHALIILDRVANEEHCFDVHRTSDLPDRLATLRQSAADRLRYLAGYDEGVARAGTDRFRRVLDDVTALISRTDLNPGAEESGYDGLRFALKEMGRNIDELEQALGCR